MVLLQVVLVGLAICFLLLDDHDCLTAMGLLVKDINGTLTGRARELLVSCVLFAVKKPSGSPRPIAMGEAFYKLACSYALSLVRDEVPPALGPIQFGVSPGGSESALHVLQSAVDLHPGLSSPQILPMLLILAPDLIFWNLCLLFLLFLLSFGSRNGLTDLSLLFSSWSVVDYVLSLLPVKGFDKETALVPSYSHSL